MADIKNIHPDIGFIEEIRANGKGNFKECMQCGTCSVVCHLSSENNPYPSKEMVWTAWGMKDKLLANPNLWLCYQCGDCTEHCPRGVNPGDVLSALREYNYKHYAVPKVLYKFLNNWRFIPIVILIPAAIIYLIVSLFGDLGAKSEVIDYSAFFPHAALNSFFGLLVLIEMILIFTGFRKFWKDLKRQGTFKLPGNIFRTSVSVLKEIFLHKRFAKCASNKMRQLAHLFTFTGFFVLLLVTLVAIVNVIFFEYPMPLFHPAKIAGNAGALLMLAGIIMFMVYRFRMNKNERRGNYSDWFFLIALLLLTISGIITEVARFENWQAAYLIYYIHLCIVWIVIIFLPYTKFSHFIYRFIALLSYKD